MSELTGMDESELISGLQGVIFRDPVKNEWQTADEYLSGNVRQKLREAEAAAETDTLHTQMETARAELGKPFPQEEELKEKSARLAELNIELNIDDKTPIEAMIDASEPAQDTRPAITAKSERTSVLAKLRAPLPQRDNHTKTENEKEER